MTQDEAPHLPGRAPLDAYGKGGFRFAGLSHRGSILIVPSGIYAWPVTRLEEADEPSFARVFAESDGLDFLLFGVGPVMRAVPTALRLAFRARGIGLDVMDTGAAARTYNVLLGEERRVGAALIAVD